MLTKKDYGSTISRSSTPLDIDEKFELSDKQIQAILDAFKRFDKKDHGFISFTEIGSAMRELGYMPNQIELND